MHVATRESKEGKKRVGSRTVLLAAPAASDAATSTAPTPSAPVIRDTDWGNVRGTI